jgi:ZIP family zinc transporter
LAASLWISLAYGAVAALANFLGASACARGASQPRQSGRLLAIRTAGAGFLAGVVLVDAVPQSLAAWDGRAWVALGLAASGYGALYVLERIVRAHVHDQHCDHEHGPSLSRAAAWTGIAGLAAHTLLDGAAVAASTTAGSASGSLVAAGLVLHQAPVGVSAAALALAASGSAREARLAGMVLAAASLVGAGAFAIAARLSPYALPLMAGITTHVVVHDLAPTLRAQGLGRTGGLAAAGALVFAASEALVRFTAGH